MEMKIKHISKSKSKYQSHKLQTEFNIEIKVKIWMK